jgi:hypothetical protein
MTVYEYSWLSVSNDDDIYTYKTIYEYSWLLININADDNDDYAQCMNTMNIW